MAISDDVLLEAVRKRILKQLEKEEGSANVTNNMYAGGMDNASHTGGVMSQLGSGQGEDPFDYLVDIERDDKRDPETGKVMGWKKKVHRYRVPKGEKPSPK